MSDEAMMAHQWVYVIVPTGAQHQLRPYMCAYCKVCRRYFTEPVPILDKGPYESASNIPKWGCVLPKDGVVI